MTTIRIDNQNCYPSTEMMKDYVAGDEFDELFVIKGNKEFNEFINTSWYEKLNDIFEDLANNEIIDEPEFYNITEEQTTEIKKLYDDCDYTEQIEVKALNIMFPNSDFRKATIRGCSQREWQEVIYDANKVNKYTLDDLQSWYFGYVSEIINEETADNVFITDDELWNWERNNATESKIRNRFGIPKDEPIEVFKSDGWHIVTKWTKIV